MPTERPRGRHLLPVLNVQAGPRASGILLVLILLATSFVGLGPMAGAQNPFTPIVEVEPNEKIAGALATYTVRFTPSTTWPSGGRLVVEFPEGYELTWAAVPAAIASSSPACASSSAPVTVVGNLLTVTRSPTDLPCIGFEVSVVLASIRNPPVSGPTGTFLVTTRDGAAGGGQQLESGQAAPITLNPGSLSTVVLAATDPSPGSTTDLRMSFTTTNPWPADGRLIAYLPSDFTLPPPEAPGEVLATGCSSGSFLAQGQAALVISRSGGASCAAGSVMLEIEGVGLPSTPSTVSVAIETRTADGRAIDAAVGTLRIGTALTEVLLTPEDPGAGATSEYELRFTSPVAWPADGSLRIDLPGGFVPSEETIDVGGTCATPGTFVASAAANSLTLSRAGGDTCPGEEFIFTLPAIANPRAAYSGVVAVRQHDTAGTDIAIGSATITLEPGVLDAPSAVASAPIAGSVSSYAFGFTTNNPWPAQGRFTAIFPEGFDVTAATATLAAGGSAPCGSGTFTLQVDVAARTVMGVRGQDTVDCPTGQEIVITIWNVHNPGVSGPRTLAIRTETANGVPIDAAQLGLQLQPAVVPFSVVVDPAVVGSSADFTFSFTPANDIPDRARFVTTFPTGFLLGSAALADVDGCDGDYALQRLGTSQTTVISRIGALACDAGSLISFSISGIRTPRLVGPYEFPQGAIRIQTEDALDIDVGGAGFVLAPNALTASTAVPTSAEVGAGTTYHIRTTLANPWPYNGRLLLRFPTGFGFSGDSSSIAMLNCSSGNFIVTKALPEIRITRSGGQDCGEDIDGDGAPDASLTLEFDLPGITNPGSAGAYTVLLETQDGSGASLDQGQALVIIGAKPMQAATAVADPAAAGAVASYTFAFKPTVQWPATGRFVATLSAGFGFEEAVSVSGTGCNASPTNPNGSGNGEFTATTSGNSLTIQRASGATCFPSTLPLRLVVSGIRTPPASGAYPIDVSTTTSDATPRLIEVGRPVVTISPAELAQLLVVPADPEAGAMTSYELSMRLTNPWPSEGSIMVGLPSGFTPQDVGASTESACIEGPLQVTIQGSNLILGRGEGDACDVGIDLTLSVTGIRNRPLSGQTPDFIVQTRNETGAPIDQGAVSVLLSPGGLEDLVVDPANDAAGASGSYMFSFTHANPLPADGRLTIRFPASVGLGSLASNVAVTGCEGGTFLASVHAQNVTIARANGAECGAGVETTLVIGPIRNPLRNTTYSIVLNSTDSQGNVIDSATTSVPIRPGVLDAVSITPGSDLVGAETTYSLRFTPANGWPADGRLLVQFPSGYVLGAVSAATTAGCASTFPTITKPTPTTLALDRQASSACTSATTVALTQIKNPGRASASNQITITTQTKSGEQTIDSLTTSVPIMASNLALAVTPSSQAPGTTTTYALSLTHAAPWPSDGRLRITFPNGFDLSQAVGAATSGCTSGQFARSLTGSTIVFDRSQGSSCTGAASFEVRNVKNPPSSGPAGALTVRTQTAGGAADIGAGSVNLNVVAANLGATSIAPNPATAGQGVSLELRFTLVNEWRPTDRLRATLPGFGLMGLSSNAPIVGCSSGSFQAGFAGSVVIITPPSGQGCPAGSAVRVTLNGLVAPTLAGTLTVPLGTYTEQGAERDIGSVAFQVRPGPFSASESTLSANPVRLPADGTSTSLVTLVLRDQYGNPLQQSGGTGSMSSTRGTLGSVTNHGDGSYTAVLGAPTQSGTAQVTGRIGTTDLATPALVAFDPGPASAIASTITALHEAITANGVSQTTIHVLLKDQYGNANTTGGAVVQLATTLGTVDETATDHHDGHYTAVLTSSEEAGVATITGILRLPGQQAAFQDMATVAFRAGSPAQLVPVDATTIQDVVAGAARTLRVRVVDDHGNPIEGSAVHWRVSRGGGMLSAPTSQSDATGVAVVALTTNTTRQANDVEATNESMPGEPVVFSVQTTSGAPSGIQPHGGSVFTGVRAGDEQVLQAIVRDANGNPVEDAQLAWSVTRGNGSVEPETSLTDEDGIASTTLTTDTLVGLNNVSVANASVPGPGALFTVETVAGPFSAANSTLVAVPARIVADGVSNSTVWAQLRDEHGNPLDASAGTMVFATSRGTLSNTTDAGNGSYQVTLRATTQAGPSIVSASIDGQALEDTATVEFVAGPAKRLLAASPTSVSGVTAGSSHQLRARVTDVHGNNVSGIRISWTAASLARVSAASSLTGADGVASVTMTSGNQTGANEVRASNTTLTGSPVVFRVTTVVGQASKLVPVGPLTIRDVVAGANRVIQVRATDGTGNGVRNINVSWSMTGSLGELLSTQSTTDNTGTASVTLKTSKTPGTIAVHAVNTTLTGSPVEFTVITRPSYVMSANGTLPAALAAGNETLVKVLVKDQHGNATPGVKVNWSVTAGGGSVVPASSVTGADGIAQTRLTTGPLVGNNTVSASNATLTGSPVNQTLRTVAGPPSTLRFSNLPASIVRDVPFTAKLELRDANGNLVARTGTASLAVASGTSGKLTGTLNRPWVQGVATFADLRFTATGSYRLLGTYQSLTNTSNAILVNPPAAAATTPPIQDPADLDEVPAIAKPYFVSGVGAKRLANGSVLVNWTPPPEQVGGYLVWRAASPFVLLAQTDAASRNWIDGDADPAHAYRYAVTFFLSTGSGFHEAKQAIEGLSGDATMPTSATVDERSTSKSLLAAAASPWVALAAIGLPLLGLSVGLLIRRRRQDEATFIVLPAQMNPLRARDSDPAAMPEPPAPSAPEPPQQTWAAEESPEQALEMPPPDRVVAAKSAKRAPRRAAPKPHKPAASTRAATRTSRRKR